jgi:CheY-like chemotaxis protein
MPKKILLVDDNQQMRTLLVKVLTGAGYQVLEASDGKTAAELAAQGPDLVIQDLILPDISGYDLVVKLKARSGRADLPVIALSGFLAKPDTPWNTEHGFVALMVKPVSNLELLETVKKYLPETGESRG